MSVSPLLNQTMIKTDRHEEDLCKTIFKIYSVFTFKMKIRRFLFPLSYLAEICKYFVIKERRSLQRIPDRAQ